MRLNKYLATAGISSRRHADELIKLGQVKVNGKVVTEFGVKVDVDQDIVEVSGKKVEFHQPVVVYLLNKPRGIVTTAEDPEGRKTVLDLVPAEPRVFPCGRLDEDTQGLVLLTNDGNLCYQLTHPKFEHEKEYIVHGQTKDPAGAFAKLQKGVRLSDGPVDIDKLVLGRIHLNKIEFNITIHEGRNRIVRRLCAAVGIEITTLTRIRVGKYVLDDVEPGKYKIVAGDLPQEPVLR